MDRILRQMALASRAESVMRVNPPVHPGTALQEKIVNARMQQRIKSNDVRNAAKLAGDPHPEDVDEELASWL